MLAIVRPDSWNFPLFLHVLGAIAVTGATAAAFACALSASRWPWLRGVVARTLLVAVFPSWLLMRVAGQWVESKENFGDDDPGWLGVGFIVGDLGLILLIAAIVIAALGARRAERRWTNGAVAVLTGVYLVALLVAMFAMSGKPGA
jgi:hypothetical protein